MYIAIIIYKSESLGHDLRTVAGPENFRPSGGVCTGCGLGTPLSENRRVLVRRYFVMVVSFSVNVPQPPTGHKHCRFAD